MAKRISVVGYKAFRNAVQQYKKHDLVYCYFSGSKCENGKSWCCDCCTAEPVVLAALDKYAKKNAVFIHAEIGDKEEFYNRHNPFRTDKDIRLTVIPAIQRWKHSWRLQSTYCARDNLLKKFFSEHAD